MRAPENLEHQEPIGYAPLRRAYAGGRGPVTSNNLAFRLLDEHLQSIIQEDNNNVALNNESESESYETSESDDESNVSESESDSEEEEVFEVELDLDNASDSDNESESKFIEFNSRDDFVSHTIPHFLLNTNHKVDPDTELDSDSESKSLYRPGR